MLSVSAGHCTMILHPSSNVFFHSRGSTRFLAFPGTFFHLQTFVLLIRRLLDGQESIEASVDASTGSHVEVARQKENAGGEHRQNPEADRGRDAAKGIQSRIVTRFPRLKLRTNKHQGYIIDSKPRSARGP
jgi:hypothetical protein